MNNKGWSDCADVQCAGWSAPLLLIWQKQVFSWCGSSNTSAWKSSLRSMFLHYPVLNYIWFVIWYVLCLELWKCCVCILTYMHSLIKSTEDYLAWQSRWAAWTLPLWQSCWKLKELNIRSSEHGSSSAVILSWVKGSQIQQQLWPGVNWP